MIASRPNDVPSQLVTVAVLVCLAAGCRACVPAQPAPPVGPPTVELRPGACFIRGKKVVAPELNGRPQGSDGLRQAISEALTQEPDTVPLILAAPEVGYDALLRAFRLTAREYELLLYARRPKPAAGDPCCSECDLVTPIRVRVQCSGKEQAWQVSAPTHSYGGAAVLDRPPGLMFAVAVGPGGFYLAASGGVLPDFPSMKPSREPTKPDGGGADFPPTIPRLNGGTLDFAGLNERVALVKAKFPTEKQLIFAADETSATAGDVCRILETVVLYFPDVVLGSF